MRFPSFTRPRPTPGEAVTAALAGAPLRIPSTAGGTVQAAHTNVNVGDPGTFPIATPWGSASLERVIFEDVFGTVPSNSRSAAMRIPAVARARNLLVSTICRFPLAAYKGEERLPDEAQPTWMYRSDSGQTPQHRLAWTVDDLIFTGWSCWWRVNGADGFPLDYQRLNQDEWTFNSDNQVEVNGVVAKANEVTVIPGLHEGILAYGYDTIRDAKLLYQIVNARLRNPVPGVDLHQTGGEPLTKDQRDELIDSWTAARQGINGSVGYTSEWIEAKEMGSGGDAQLMIEARNAASLDLARMVGVAGARIDATSAMASLTYETTTGRNQEFVDFDLALYMTPIMARLSLDDVLPRGTRCQLELADFIGSAPSVSGPPVQD